MERDESRLLTYVLVTPARNEEAYIQKTIESVVSQTVLPLRWVIVSDGSTDRTDEIVRTFEKRHDWIELIRMPEHADRQFASKVHAFNAGYERLQGLSYELIGSLDADLSFGPDYFEFLLGRFAADPRLGVAGTPFVENGSHYDYRFANIEHVSGACQLFRRECFEEIGGYIAIKGGGIDWVAVTTARMKGWRTRTFTERACVHHRPIWTAAVSPLRGQFSQGQQDWFLGGHPAWQVLRAGYQMTRPPYVVGGLGLLAGFWWALISRMRRPVSEDLVRFHRAEQMARLKSILRGTGKREGLNP
jgi:poly-beta-1,6-N-acetyl-D-glucosamine synthase